MTNNLRQISKDLRAFAKRTKDFKYTNSALVTFLMTGVVTITSASMNKSIENQKQGILSSIKGIQQKVKETRRENDKLLKNTNLELIQLMEQGDHVVKSPWSSWQYGMNYFYNDWHGTFKGRGNKLDNTIYQRDTTMAKYKYNRDPQLLYGNTTKLGRPIEPNAAIPVSASLTPLIPKIKQANLALGIDISNLPAFEPRTVTAPKAPTIAPLDRINTPMFSMDASSIGNGGEWTYDNPYGGTDGVIEAVAILKGNFLTRRTNDADGQGRGLWTYSYDNYDVTNAFNTNQMGTYTSPGTWVYNLGAAGASNASMTGLSRASITSNAKTGFMRMVSGTGAGNNPTEGSTMLNRGQFMYTQSGNTNGFTRELVHLDIHNAKTFAHQETQLTNNVNLNSTDAAMVAFKDVEGIAAATTASTHSQTYINDGTTIIEGSYSSFSNSYDHVGDDSAGPGGDNYVSSVINTSDGNIMIHPLVEGGNTYSENSAAFIVSNSVYRKGSPQILYNAGNIEIYNKNSTVFFINPNQRLDNGRGSYTPGDATMKREVTIVNRADSGNDKKIATYGENSVGIFIKTMRGISTANLDFRDKADTKWNPITLYGDRSIGLYVPVDTISQNGLDPGSVIGNIAFNIGDSNKTSHETYKANKSAALGVTYDKFTTAGTLGVPVALNENKASDENTSEIIDRAYGIYSNADIDLESDVKGIKAGHEINIYNNTKNNIAVLPGNSISIKLGKGSVNLIGGVNNIGIVAGGSQKAFGDVANTDGKVRGDVVTITGDSNDRGNRAIYAWDGNSKGNNVEVNAVKSTNATNSVAIVADKNASITINSKAGSTTPPSIIGTAAGTGLEYGVKIDGAKFVYDNTRTVSATDLTSTDSVGAAYANNYSTITMNRVALPSATDGANISITGGKDSVTKQYVGFGLFADNNSTINAEKNWIKVKNGSTNVASLNNSTVDLKGSTVEYEGEGYALYTDNTSKTTGAIDMTNGKFILAGKAVGYVRDLANPSTLTFSNTDIEINSDDVIVSDLRNSGGVLTVNVENKAAPDRLRDQLLGTGLNPVTSSTGATRYKYAVVDNATINIKSDIDKANTTVDSDSDVFTRRFLYQNSRINVDNGVNVKAELDTTLLNGIDKSLTVPVGLAVSASGNSKNTATTGINNSGIVSADRTDGADKGGIGLYVNYGYLNNKATGVINVEKGTANGPNKQGIGIYGTNSTDIANEGKVNVGGEKSIGILGLSYRIDPSTGLPVDPANEPYKAATTPFGMVNVVNAATGIVTMDNDGAVGIFVKNNSIDKDSSGNYAVTAANRKNKSDTKATNKGKVTINGSSNSVAVGANNAIITNDATGKINVNGTESAGMYGTNDSELINTGEITIAATSQGSESIGIYIDDQNSTIKTSGKINVGNYSYGIFGKKVDMTGGEINVSDGGVGIYSTGPTVNLTSGKISVANNNAVGVYIADDKSNATATAVTGNVEMKVGDTDSFGYLITATKAKTDLTTSGPAGHVGEKAVYIYSAAPRSLGGKITNNADIVTDKNNGYAIYSSQDADNNANINLKSGAGNIGMYSTQGIGRNFGIIEVGKTITVNEEYGIGMATGYFNKATSAISNEGTIENHGTINVTEENSVGMYAVGSGSKAINTSTGVINLSGNNTTGMFIDQGATGINYGTIQTTPTTNGRGIKGVVVINNGILKNYGTIAIAGNKNMGVYKDGTGQTSATAQDTDTVTGQQGKNTSVQQVFVGTPTDQKVTGKVVVKVPPASAPNSVAITLDGAKVTPVLVDTNAASPKAPEILITDVTGATTLNLATEHMDHTHSKGEVSSIGMYIDTSGINYTNPIQGVEHLDGLTDIDLIIGSEAARYLNAKAIQIGDNILKPYNDELGKVVTTGVTLNINSASLTWIAQPVQSGVMSSPLKTVYMIKIPYTDFASENDNDTEHFLDGLEQRYGVEGINSREKQLFNKLNDIGKGESHIFVQAVNEMKGYQYSNTQQRINVTGSTLDKEFSYLKNDWRNPSKQNNKIKMFGTRDEYNTDTAGIIDYKSNAYGVAYVHEDEKIRMGNSSGWYAGVVTNRFKFKDLGHSNEDQTMIKAGIFKTISPKADYNGALQWTIAGDVFTGKNNMRRKYWIVDDTFEAKSDYWTYGAAFKTDIGYDIRMSERTHLRPYGALKMEYGRFSDINEDRGEIRLKVKGNDYFSVRPEVGMELKYVQPLGVRTNLSVGLFAAYENEIGKLNKLNQAKVRYTSADWYNLRNEKEDRRGNGKFDVNIGVDNTKFGVTVNAGYDTKGNNVRGGIGFRAVY